METKRIQEVKLYEFYSAKFDILEMLREGWYVHTCTANKYHVLVVYEKQIRV